MRTLFPLFGSLVLAAVVCGVFPGRLWAQPSQSGFRAIVAQRQQELAREMAAYVQKNPDAADAPQAAEWLIKYALQSGQEAEIVGLLEEYLKKEGLDSSTLSQGQQALCLGLAKTDQITGALEVFDRHLRGVRQSSASRSLEFAHQLATQVRLKGDFDSSRAVYQRLTEAFPFSPVVSEIAQSRMGKLELAGKPAPPLGGQDTSGKDLDLGALSGKVVIVDFWATNCPPCLEEMPRMKALYKDYHDKGLEIVGISLDERQTLVDDYVQQTGLTWPMALNRQPTGPLTDKYKVVTIPSLFVVDAKGNVAQVDVYGDDLRSVVEKLLAK